MILRQGFDFSLPSSSLHRRVRRRTQREPALGSCQCLFDKLVGFCLLCQRRYEKEIAAMKYLERRECEYDTKTYLDFYREGETSEPALTGVLAFMSTMDKEANKYYLGPAPLVEMARQIATAKGPFGNNRDYLFLLEKAMSNIEGGGDGGMNQSASELILEALFHLGDDDRSSPPLSLEELLLPAALGFGWDGMSPSAGRTRLCLRIRRSNT